MATQKQIKANRQNAQKSTGPKSDEGKASVCQNAVKHGLFAESVITGENQAEYEAFHDQMLAELAPVGVMELMMAERIVSLWWRLRRAERMQNQVIEDMIEDQVTNPWAVRRRKDHCRYEGLQPEDPKSEPEHLALGRIAIRDWAECRILDRMLLYERRIESSLNRAMRELKRFQTVRRIEWQDTRQQQLAVEPGPSAEKYSDLKKQSQLYRSAYDIPSAERANLKKQSQFLQDIMSIMPFMTRGYGDNPAGNGRENKANQAQFDDNEPVRGENAPALRNCQ